MNENSPKDMQKLLQDRQAIAKVLKSPQAQALAQILNQNKQQPQLKKAAESAAKGDTSQLGALMQSLMQDPESAQLLQQLEKSLRKD